MRHPIRKLAVAVGVAIAASAVAATPAQAIPAVDFVTEWTDPDSAPVKSVTATCPHGTVVYGGGGGISDLGEDFGESNGGRDVVLQIVYPDPSLDSVGANAYEDETGYANNWEVTAFAMCADPSSTRSARTWPSSAR